MEEKQEIDLEVKVLDLVKELTVVQTNILKTNAQIAIKSGQEQVKGAVFS